VGNNSITVDLTTDVAIGASVTISVTGTAKFDSIGIELLGGNS
jgi:hypothetical protein